MKRNDIQALDSKTIAELQTLLGELRTKLAVARMDKIARKPLPNGTPSVISDDIARIKLALSKKVKADQVRKSEDTEITKEESGTTDKK
jgi:ribosomal protein L29